METKRKSPDQLQALESFYSDDKYPAQLAMEELAEALALTLKQVRGWFVERRRRDKKDNGSILSKELSVSTRRNGMQVASVRSCRSKAENTTGQKMNSLTDLLTPGHILTNFCDDGPALNVQFDSLPSRPLHHSTGYTHCHPLSQENESANKKRKVSKHSILDRCDNNKNSVPVKKHGMGKGLMALWRLRNPDGDDFPTDLGVAIDQVTRESWISTSTSKKQPFQKKTPRQLPHRLGNEVQNKRKPPIKRREVESKDDYEKQPHNTKCELALEEATSQELNKFATLVDDEELELRELQTGPNPLTCSDHFATNGLHGCSLCKGLLTKFPPISVKMKQPFGMQPWDSSSGMVKKLFKVFHFLYTYAVMIDIRSFTLDEFTQAFHDKDSSILGKIHVALLRNLLFDVETELSSGFLPHLNVSCKFLVLLHSIKNHEFIVEFWKRSLNPLTWPEILQQVLISAGFGLKQGAKRKDGLGKELHGMVKYGLRPGTLKGELFRQLAEQGKHGSKVSDLAKSSQIAELNLCNKTEELELIICSTLSSDITLFEKISSSAYRLRNAIAKEVDDIIQSDTEDSGSVEDDSGACSSSDDSDCVSRCSNFSKLKAVKHHKIKDSTLTVDNEIDESRPGEVWILGLMESEYSNLSIEEKLNVLVALVDLLSAGSSFRMKDPKEAIVECVPTIHHGSGAKIKRSSYLSEPSWVHPGRVNGPTEACRSSESCPIDSSAIVKTFYGKEKPCGKEKDAKETDVRFYIHPMQSIFLGSDRRYNRYWLFLGPCDACDPGHKRVYFESSDDGHWEVIDTEEDLRTLLSVLDDRGVRESVLIESLEKRGAFLCEAMSCEMPNNVGIKHLPLSDQSNRGTRREDSASPVSGLDNSGLTETANGSVPPCGAMVLEAGTNANGREQKWKRIQAFDSWIWNFFYSVLNVVKLSRRSYLESLARCQSCHDLYWRDEKHCKICHITFELDFDLEERYAIHTATCREKDEIDTFPVHKVLSSQLQALKAAIHAVESSMPEGALVGAWTKSVHRLWVRRLRRTSSLMELFQVLADFVGAINVHWWCQHDAVQGSHGVVEEIIASFPTMPRTSAAVALWLVKLDALLAPYLEKVCSEKKQKVWTRPNEDKHTPKL